VFDLLNKLQGIVLAVWLIIAFPAILRLAFTLSAQGRQEWKQLFRRKRTASKS
jgi:hypothetical protein